MPGLGTSFGRGGATTALQDLQHADCVLIQGSSMAEAHPVGFRWVVRARERGATVIHVDPRFSRTSALADHWLPIRAGGDLAFLGGLIRHVLETERYFEDYVRHYTNAAFLLREDFRDTEDLDGLFSGWDPARGAYDTTTWQYATGPDGQPIRDPTLAHPRCVLQVLRRHFARYTPETVERVAGVPPAQLERVADALTAASGPERTAAICYAVGWTQHSKGVQIIRAAAVLQLLLGNIGRPGGGILALRGHASIQGSTDIPTLYDILPGYLPMPWAGRGEDTLAGYLERHTPRAGWWRHTPTYVVSLLKAYYGRHATAENDWGWQWLPRCTRDHSHFSFFTEMADGEVEGLFVMGQNPAVGAQHARLERKALAELDWLVVRDLVEIETASFWYDSPEVGRGELRPEDIGTEVFLLPAAGHAEKAGSFTQTQRMLQWREKAVSPPGDARSEAWFIHQLAKRLQARARASDHPADRPLRALDWWYREDAHGEPDMAAVLAEINGWYTLDPSARRRADAGNRPDEKDRLDDPARGLGQDAAETASAAQRPVAGVEHDAVEAGADGPPDDDGPAPDGVVHGRDADGRPHHGPQVPGFSALADDGTTACGCWIYAGVYGPDGVNRAARRRPEGRYGHGWGYAWPSDRRILYNRASARPDGRPWSERKALVWWDAAAGRWTGHDVPDFPASKPPGYVPPADAEGAASHPGDAPFLMHPEGVGRLFVPHGLADGPLPTHYEPLESPVENALYGQQTNPAAHWYHRPDNPFVARRDRRFPYVLTTYRLTEHHTAGGMSRFLGQLSELQPELFVELSPELATELGITTGDWATVATPRGAVEARALVTRRIRPLVVGNRTVHQVAMPFHWGSAGPVRGDVVNDLIPLSGEPNVRIHEGKAVMCAVLPGRRPRGTALREWLDELAGRPTDGPAHRDDRSDPSDGSDRSDDMDRRSSKADSG